jgi:hypothetical protein
MGESECGTVEGTFKLLKHHTAMRHWHDRFRAAGIHLGISLLIAALAAALVFYVWYPSPYGQLSGGRELFTILISVDVILGPLITFSIFNRAKPVRELRRDLAVVALIQLSALGYGLWAVFGARPVHLVFEIDRFRVVHAVDVPVELLKLSPPDIEALPLTGPTLLAVRQFRDRKEETDATLAALQGIALGARPDLWQNYSAGQAAVLKAARPVTQLRTRFTARAGEIDAVLHKAGRQAETTAYLPLVGRKVFWTAFIDPVTAKVVAFLPLDSF